MASGKCPAGGKHDWMIIKGYGTYHDVRACMKCGARESIVRQKKNEKPEGAKKQRYGI